MLQARVPSGNEPWRTLRGPQPAPLPAGGGKGGKGGKGKPTNPEEAKQKTGAGGPICIGFNGTGCTFSST